MLPLLPPRFRGGDVTLNALKVSDHSVHQTVGVSLPHLLQ
jgi:hypothetical protein